MGRVLGVDLGDRRVGLALSDVMRIVATPLETITLEQPNQAVNKVLEVARREGVDALVVGLPLNMDGSRGPRVELTDAFMEKLKKRAEDLELFAWDERLSSQEAERVLIQANTSRRKRRGAIDRMAAQLILQSWLDAQPGGGSGLEIPPSP